MANILDLIQVIKENKGKSTMTSGNKYEITMAYMNKQIVFNFHDNYKNASEKIDFLYALINDSNAIKNTKDIKDFCDYYGYGNEYAKDIINIYNDCKLQLEKYNKLFNETEQQEIENLLADY